jgi:phosphomevalonate kinase
MSVRLAACAKVFLGGEYAVLEGGRPALVVGLDRKLHVSVERSVPGIRIVHAPSGLVWDGGTPPPELRFAVRAIRLALRFCGQPGDLRIVFEDDLALDGRKLGLGGSAAASVLAVRAVCAVSGRAVNEDALLSLALAAHWTEQGGSGSGADVAAAMLGGVLEVRSRIPWQTRDEVMAMAPEEIAATRPLQVTPVETPPDLRLLLAYAGRPADTISMVRDIRRFARAEPARWVTRVAEISAAAERLRGAFESREPESALDAVRAGAAAMARLGEDARVAIVTPELAHACALASAAGAAGKPSGAGGGDCAVIVAFGDEARDRAEAALRPHFPVFRVAPA